MTADVISFPPNPQTIGTATAKALGQLGLSMLPEAEKQLEALLQSGERTMAAIGELLAETRDEKLPDYARDLATHKLTRARACYRAIVEEAAVMIRRIDLMRSTADQEPHVIRLIADALNSPSGDVA